MKQSLILPCSSCSTLNRVPTARLHDGPICRDCGARLLGGEPAKLDGASFDQFVGRSDLPVLVDFWAPWCGPCRVMAPQFAAASQQLAGRALLAKVDTDQNQELAARFQIQGIPTLILFQGGREVARMSGAMQSGPIVAWVEQQVNGPVAGR
ncbi:MAG TPA: thioredoxin TrxC [Polyangiaceae bacterium]|nr:thioredoxin TrxC [Polyangiaceae bacterium]